MEGKHGLTQNPDDDLLEHEARAYAKFLQLTGMHYPKPNSNKNLEDDIAGKTLAEIWNVGGSNKQGNSGSRTNSIKLEETSQRRGSLIKPDPLFSRNSSGKVDSSDKTESPSTKLEQRSTSPRLDSLKRQDAKATADAINKSKILAVKGAEIASIPMIAAQQKRESVEHSNLKPLKTSKPKPADSELDKMFEELISLSESNDNDDTEEKKAKQQQKLDQKKPGKIMSKVSKMTATVKKGMSKLKSKRRSKQIDSDASNQEPDWDQSYVSHEVEDSSEVEASEDDVPKPSPRRKFSISKMASETDESQSKGSRRGSFLRKSTEISSESANDDDSKPTLLRTISARRNTLVPDPDAEMKQDAIKRLLSPRKSSVSLSSTPKLSFQRHLEERLDPELLDDLLLITMLLTPGGDDGPEHYQVVREDRDKQPLYFLLRISECSVLAKPFHNNQLQSRSILFCLDRMRTPVHTLTQKKFSKMSAAPLQQWFAMLDKKKIRMKENLAEDLFCNFYKMQKILIENPAITKLDLLYSLHPQLKSYYEPAFELTEVNGRYRNLPAIKLVELAQKDTAIQYNNARRAYEDWSKIDSVKADLIAGNVQSFKQLKIPEVIEFVLSGFKKKDYADGKLVKSLQTCLTTMAIYPVYLDLSYTTLDLKSLKKVLSDRGKNLITLKLNHCSQITDEIITLLSKRCPALLDLSLRDTSVTGINETLSVVNLDLSSNPKIVNTTLNSIMRKCTMLRMLSLGNTQISQTGVSIAAITHLDLSGCKLEETFFEQLRSNTEHLKSLRVNSPHIKELDLKQVEYLMTLDLSDSPNLTKIYSNRNEDGSFAATMMQHQGLQVLRANNCPNLTEINIVDAKSLTALYANNCALTTILLSPNQPLAALSIIEINYNPRLQIFLVDPTRVSRFMAQNCHQIITPPNDALCRRYLEQVVGSVNKSTMGFSTSALTALLRFKSAKWAAQQLGRKVFFNISAPGVDARCADLNSANFYNADIRGINLTDAKLNYSCFTKAKMAGTTFGQLSSLESRVPVTALASNRAGTLFFRAYNDGCILILDRDETILHQIKLHRPAHVLALNHDEKRLALAGHCQLLKQQEDSDSSEDMYEDAVRPQDSDIIGFSDQFYIFVYDIDPKSTERFQQLWAKPAHSRMITALAFTADGKSIISCSQDEKIKLFDATTGAAIRIIADTSSQLRSLALNGLLFAYGDGDGFLNLWNVKTSTRIAPGHLKAHNGVVQQVLFTSNGQSLITTGADKDIHIWNVSNWKRKTLQGHKEWVECLALSPDNKYLFSAESSSKRIVHAVRVWNVKTGELLQQYGINSSVRAMIVDPVRVNGNWVIQVACENNCILRLLFNESDPVYIYPERRELTAFDATNMDVDETEGLSPDQLKLLEQRGAIHKSFSRNSIFTMISNSSRAPSDLEADDSEQLTDSQRKDNL